MVKAKLGSLTEKWIVGKVDKQLNSKVVKQNTTVDKKIQQAFYLSEKAAKLLRHHRAETGETISDTVEKIVIEHFEKSTG